VNEIHFSNKIMIKSIMGRKQLRLCLLFMP